jgi:hypothetical protein
MHILPSIELTEPFEGAMTPAQKVAYSNLLLAICDGATEFHLQPQADEGVEVLKKIGSRFEATNLECPSHMTRAVVNIIKVMADLDHAVRGRPRQGFVSFEVYGEPGPALVVVGRNWFGERVSVYFLGRHPGSALARSALQKWIDRRDTTGYEETIIDFREVHFHD